LRKLLFLVFLLLLAGCHKQPANRVLPQRSPDGRYVFDFDRGVPVIKEDRLLVLRDEAAPFRENPDLYWLWDGEGRLWIYDDASKRVYYYQKTPEGWRRYYWSGERSDHPESDLLPPLGLYPPCPTRH